MFWEWSLGGGREVQWPVGVFPSFRGKSVYDHRSGELRGGEVVKHKAEMQ